MEPRGLGLGGEAAPTHICTPRKIYNKLNFLSFDNMHIDVSSSLPQKLWLLYLYETLKKIDKKNGGAAKRWIYRSGASWSMTSLSADCQNQDPSLQASPLTWIRQYLLLIGCWLDWCSVSTWPRSHSYVLVTHLKQSLCAFNALTLSQLER